MSEEKTITELYEFLQEHMVTKEELKKEKEELRKELNELKKEMTTKEELKKTELSLKDYLDEKLADLKGDLAVLMRKENYKLYLVKLLKEKNIISDEEVKKIISMEPFPKPSL